MSPLGLYTSGLTTINNCTFADNNASAVSSNAGGLRHASGNLSVVGSTFRNNHARRGGALYLNQPTIWLQDVLLEGNVADEAGGAVYMMFGTGPLAGAQLENIVLRFNTVLTNASGSDAGGGAVYLDSPAPLSFGGESVMCGNSPSDLVCGFVSPSTVTLRGLVVPCDTQSSCDLLLNRSTASFTDDGE